MDERKRPVAPSVPRGHEPSDIGLGGSVRFGIVLAVLVGGLILLLTQLYPLRRTLDASLRTAGPVAPRLEDSATHDLEALRAAEDRELGSYGWVDRQERRCRIPIHVAMEKLVRQGFPLRPPERQAE